MHILKLYHGGFVVPVSNGEKQSVAKQLNGYGGKLSVFGMQADQKSPTFTCFANKMGAEESRLLECIRSFVSD